MKQSRISKAVQIGNIQIGANNPVAVQSMLNKPAHDIDGNVSQALALQNAGCQIIRCACPDMQAVKTIEALKNAVDVPIVADIHFDHKLALACCDVGVDKIRINPGNIGDESNVKAVAKKCDNLSIPIRIGVNSGSLQMDILKKYGSPTPQAMAESAMEHARLLEKYDFNNIVISIKSSSVQGTIEAYRTVSTLCDYPLHLGVTEAGTARMGLIKSAIGIGSLLCDGIGDTIRVSLTDDPVNEIKAGRDILKSIDMLTDSPQLVSCPTCGRTQIDLISLANEVEKRLENVNKKIKVAVMGCIVNGPGEAKEADIGIAGGKNCGLIFKHGQILKKVSEDDLVDRLMEEIEKL